MNRTNLKYLAFILGLLLPALQGLGQQNGEPQDRQDTAPKEHGAQAGRRVLSVEYRDMPLGRILEDLAETHRLPLSYSSAQLKLEQRISLRLRDQSPGKVLEQLGRLAGFSYTVVNGQYVLKPVKKSAQPQGSGVSYQIIRGWVRDKSSGVPLPGAVVQLLTNDPPTGVHTDEDGGFRLDHVPVGRHVLEISMLGYESLKLPDVLLTAGKEANIEAWLRESVSSLGTVTVTDNASREALNEMAQVSARSFSVEETSRYAASVFDPARMALNFSGVTSGHDGSNSIIIRGNTPKSLLWRLEGIEIINPNHFGEEGSSGGGVSMISSSMLSNSDFLTGAFPAEYGNAISGVFDLHFRKGNTEKREYALMAGALGTEISAEGPFRKGGKASYLANYRYSTLSLLDKAGITPFGEDGIPDYQDLAFNLVFPTEKAGTFSAFGIGGLSLQRMEASDDQGQWESFTDKFNRIFRYHSGSAGIKHLWLLNDKLYVRQILSASGSRIRDHADTLDAGLRPGIYGRDKYLNSAFRYSGMLHYKAGARHSLRAGLVISRLGFDLNSYSYKKDIDRLTHFLLAEGNAWNQELYAQWKHETGHRISLGAGVHLNYFNLSGTWYAEPRLNFAYRIAADQKISLGAGLHSRVEPLAFYFARQELADGSTVQSNSSLAPTRALHLIGAYERLFGESTRFKAEAYFQHLFRVPVSADPAYSYSALNAENAYLIYSRNYPGLVNKGTGRNTGLDLSLERALHQGYYFLLNASVLDSKFRTLRGLTFNTSFNSRYSASLVAGKEWKSGPSGKNLLGLNTRIMSNGGMRYSPIDLKRSLELDEQVIDESKVNTLRTSPYFRLDMSLTYRINRPGLTHAVFLDIQNVLNRRNEYGLIYEIGKNELEMLRHAGLIPSLYYRIEF